MEPSLRDALAAVEDRHWWFEGRRRIIRDTLRRLGVSGSIAEVGCGNGANLAMLSEFGPVWGVEPDPGDRSRAAARGIGTVVSGTLPHDLDLPAGEFAAVLALDVVEHVEADAEAVSALADLASPQGVVIITVPAHPWMWSAHDDRNGHIRRYTPGTLSRLVTDAGLEVTRLSYFNSFLFGPISIARTVGRLVGLDKAGIGVPAAPINRTLVKLLGVESRLLARFDLPVGVSLLAIANR